MGPFERWCQDMVSTGGSWVDGDHHGEEGGGESSEVGRAPVGAPTMGVCCSIILPMRPELQQCHK